MLTVAAVLAGCSLISDSKTSSQIEPIQTDRNTYTAGLERIFSVFRTTYRFEMTVRLENTTGDTLFIPYLTPPCNSPFYGTRSMLPNLKPGSHSVLTQVRTGMSTENPCYESAIALEPGVVRVDTIQIGGPPGWKSGTNEFLGTMEGPFRLVSEVGTCRDEETNRIDPDCRLPDSLASNVFEVRLDEGPELPQAELIQTDSTSYVAEQEDIEPGADPLYGFKVEARFENTTGQTIYLSRCGEQLSMHGASRVGPEPREYETSAYVLSPAPWQQQDCAPNPIALTPGTARTDTLEIQGPGPGARDHNGEPTGELEGQFVLKYVAGLCLEEKDGTTTVGCLLSPENLPRSNSFEVQLAE